MSTIKIRRGPEATIPTLNVGEFGYTTDTDKLYLGTGTSNILLSVNGVAPDSSKLGGKQYSKYLSTTTQTLTSTATTTLNVLSYDNFILTLNQDTTLAFSNLSSKIGASGTIVLKQDSTGGRTFTLPSEAKTPLGQSIDQYTTANSVSTLMYFIIDASTVLINYVGGWS